MRLAQWAVFGGLTVFFHELDRTIPIGAAVILALGLTAALFSLILLVSDKTRAIKERLHRRRQSGLT